MKKILIIIYISLSIIMGCNTFPIPTQSTPEATISDLSKECWYGTMLPQKDTSYETLQKFIFKKLEDNKYVSEVEEAPSETTKMTYTFIDNNKKVKIITEHNKQETEWDVTWENGNVITFKNPVAIDTTQTLPSTMEMKFIKCDYVNTWKQNNNYNKDDNIPTTSQTSNSNITTPSVDNSDYDPQIDKIGYVDVFVYRVSNGLEIKASYLRYKGDLEYLYWSKGEIKLEYKIYENISELTSLSPKKGEIIASGKKTLTEIGERFTVEVENIDSIEKYIIIEYTATLPNGKVFNEEENTFILSK